MTAQIKKPFTGRHMLMLMLTFFAVVLSANLALVYYSQQSWTGLVVKNAYVASQAFNKTTEDLEKAEATAHAELRFENNRLHAKLRDGSGKILLVQILHLHMGRPSHEGEDRDLVLQGDMAGNYVASVELAAGQWSGLLSTEIPGHGHWERPVYFFVGDQP